MATGMTLRPNSVLPERLSARLKTLGAGLEYGPSDLELDRVLADFSALPPNLIVRASREIATTANLSWWKPRKRFSLMRPLRKRLSNRDLLRKNPDYAWLLLFHSDGYVREIALDAIARPPDSPFLFAALAWRLNDWVEPVRQAAKRCAGRVLPLVRTDIAVSGALYLLDRRLVWGRWRDEVETLDGFFARADVIAALAEQCRDRRTGPVATCLRHALRYPNIDGHLADLAANAMQPAVRAVAYRCLMTGKARWPADYEWEWIDKVYGLRRRVLRMESRDIEISPPIAETIRQAMQDRSVIVRVLAADSLTDARAHMANADNLIAELAKDRSYAVRWRADYMLRNPVAPVTASSGS
jgi:hypothetical protein